MRLVLVTCLILFHAELVRSNKELSSTSTFSTHQSAPLCHSAENKTLLCGNALAQMDLMEVCQGEQCRQGWTQVSDCVENVISATISIIGGAAFDTLNNSQATLPFPKTQPGTTQPPVTQPQPSQQPAATTVSQPQPTTGTEPGLTVTPTSSASVYCTQCPDACTECAHAAGRIACSACAKGFDVDPASYLCVDVSDPGQGGSDSDKLTIILVSACGAVVIVVIAVAVIVLVRRKKRGSEAMTGQCNVNVITSDELTKSGQKRKVDTSRSCQSMTDETGELVKLPDAPPIPEPELGYDSLQQHPEEQLDYTPLDLADNSKDKKGSPMVAQAEDNVYMNTAFHSANGPGTSLPSMNHAHASSNHTSASNALETESVYINVGAASPSGLSRPLDDQDNADPATLEMDEIYMNQEVEVRPEPSTDSEYHQPVSNVASRQSDIYMNTNTNSVYQNL